MLQLNGNFPPNFPNHMEAVINVPLNPPYVLFVLL